MALSDSKMDENKIVIYQTEDGQTQIDVRLENETVWLTQAQMAELFEKTPQNITMHIRNAYNEGELEKESTCKEYLQVQTEGKRKVKRIQKYYDLDVIISVGYRVKSKHGTAFRIWARKIIKNYLVKGYAVNERIRKEQIGELRQLVQVVGRAINNQELPNTTESQDLLNVVVDYTSKSPSMLLTRMRWRPSMACARNSEAPSYLAMRRMTRSRAV